MPGLGTDCQDKPVLKPVFQFLVPEPKTTIVGNDELFIEAGSTINLTCTIQTGPTTDALIYWNYNGKVLAH